MKTSDIHERYAKCAQRILHNVRGSRCSARALRAHRITAAYAPWLRAQAPSPQQAYAADIIGNKLFSFSIFVEYGKANFDIF